MRWMMAILAASLCAGCERPPHPDADAPGSTVRVVTTLPPLAWPAEMLWGEEADVYVLMPEGASPHGWEPTPSDALAVRDADVLIAEDEEALRRVLQTAGDPDIVALSFHNESVLLELCGRTTCGSQHPWLDPAHVLAFGVIADAWGIGTSNAQTLRDRFFAALPPSDPRRTDRSTLVLTSHAAWDRFFAWIGVTDVVAIRNDHHHEGAPAHFAAVRERALAAERVLVVQEPGHDDPWLRALAEEVGAAAVTLDPVGTRDWAGDMKKRYEAVEAALESLR